MTEKEIIAMAKRARISTAAGYFGSMEQIITFARLIAAKQQELDAQICEVQEDNGGEWDIQQQCANAIRGQK
jgi:hypothetical protein